MTLLEEHLRRQLPELADSFVVPGDLRARVDHADRRQRRRHRTEAVLAVVALLGAGLAVREGVVRHDRTTPAGGTGCGAIEQVDEFHTGVVGTGTAGSREWSIDVSGTASNPFLRAVIDGETVGAINGRIRAQDNHIDVDAVSLGIAVWGDVRIVFGMVPAYVAEVVVDSTARPGNPIVLCALASGDPTMNWVAPTAIPPGEPANVTIVDMAGRSIGAGPLLGDRDGVWAGSINVVEPGR